MIRSFEKKHPRIADTAYVDDSAVVIGDVEIGENSSIWPGVVVRGDIHRIIIGQRTSIQDNSVIHVTHAGEYTGDGFSTQIGNGVTVGHAVILHGCTIMDGSLIGMRSCILDGAVVEPEVMLGAGSLVPPGKILTRGHLWLGSPVKCVRALTTEELSRLQYSADYYVSLKNRYGLPESL